MGPKEGADAGPTRAGVHTCEATTPQAREFKLWNSLLRPFMPSPLKRFDTSRPSLIRMLSNEEDARNRRVAAIILLTPLYAVGPAELSDPDAAVAKAEMHSTRVE